MSADIITARRENTASLLHRVTAAFLEELGDQRDRVLGTHTTVYVTGSGGRGDMGAASDLDPYVVRHRVAASSDGSDDSGKVIDIALQRAVAISGLPELDASGKFALLVSAESL